MNYVVTKETLAEPSWQQMLLYPPREGDSINSFISRGKAELWVQNNINNPIYSDCIFDIIECSEC
jgi:hypothetical protein